MVQDATPLPPLPVSTNHKVLQHKLVVTISSATVGAMMIPVAGLKKVVPLREHAISATKIDESTAFVAFIIGAGSTQDIVAGLTKQYAAPEVVATFGPPETAYDPMMDVAQDIYSFGVMIPQVLFVEANSRFSDKVRRSTCVAGDVVVVVGGRSMFLQQHFLVLLGHK